jgi:hypothetical protein
LNRGNPAGGLYTLLFVPELVSDAIRNRPGARVSGLQRVRGSASTTVVPAAVSAGDGSVPAWPAGTDLVLSTSHCVAKGLVPPPGAKHVCYCFTPMRYAWALQEEYFGRGGLKRALIDRMLARLRDWDRAASDRVDRFVAISRHVQARIRKSMGGNRCGLSARGDGLIHAGPAPADTTVRLVGYAWCPTSWADWRCGLMRGRGIPERSRASATGLER